MYPSSFFFFFRTDLHQVVLFLLQLPVLAAQVFEMSSRHLPPRMAEPTAAKEGLPREGQKVQFQISVADEMARFEMDLTLNSEGRKEKKRSQSAALFIKVFHTQ